MWQNYLVELFLKFLAFFGSWLLFAGPIFQAAHELKEQALERDRIRAASSKISISRHVSAWWWLLPPMKLILEQIQTRRWQREYFKALEPEDRQALASYMNKATGWLIVAGGALLISIEATFELGETLEWAWWLILIAIVLCVYASLLYTVRNLVRDHKITSAE